MMNVRQRLLASTLLFGAAAAPTQVYAQATPPETPENQTAPVTSQPKAPQPGDAPAVSGQQVGPSQTQEIIITGSRIPRPDLNSSSPLTVVKAQEFALTGSNTVEQVINTLPQVIPSISSFSNNPGGGVALLNLRGLGVQRNLVLVNGRRWMFFDASQVVDLNTIPAFLIDSVDVVTGGASAVYGSDALAGVTNFHLRTDLEGVMLGANYAITQHGDGARYDVNGAIGTRFADGRGNLTAYGEYYDRSAIFQNQRDFSRCVFQDTGEGNINGTGFACGGSSNPPQGRFTASSLVSAGTNYAGSGAFFGTPGTSTPFVRPDNLYNYAPSNYLMVPQKRWALGGYGEYEVIDGHHLYTEVSFVNNRVENQLAPSPFTQNVNVPLTGAGGFCVTPGAAGQLSAADCTQLALISSRELAANAAAAAAGKPLPFGATPAGAGTVGVLQPGFVRLTANYRLASVANRLSSDDRNSFRTLVGARGEITSDWNYDVYYSYARNRNAQQQRGNAIRSGIAANVENGTCDLFGANQLSQECLDAIAVNSTNLESSTLEVANGNVAGHLFTSPWAHEAVGLSLGAEWRRMDGSFDPDTFLASGDVVGFNAGSPTHGSYDAKEAYGEIRLPLIEQNFIDRLELNGGFRYSKYSLKNVGGVWTYFAGAELSPVKDILLRAQYQRAIRAPNIAELFGGIAAGFPAAVDPCKLATALTDPAIRATCIGTGVPVEALGTGSVLQPNAQIEGAFGGNPNLKQETGDTYTAGVVLRPRFIPRLNAAVDWYKIRVKGAVAAAGGGVNGILNLCYNVIQDPNNPICQLIHRDTSGILSGGGVFIVNAANANLGQLDTQGIDTQIDYSTPVSFGLLGERSKLTFYSFLNYQWDNSFIPVPGLPRVQCAGLFAGQCGQPTPKWKAVSRIAWSDGPLTTSLRWRYIGRVKDENGPSSVSGFDVDHIPAWNYFDLAFALNVTDHATMTFGINNLFDKKPPLMGSSQAEQANTYPSTYDPLGRDFFFSVNFKL
jgi:iron complex outermembrane receptor protein